MVRKTEGVHEKEKERETERESTIVTKQDKRMRGESVS